MATQKTVAIYDDQCHACASYKNWVLSRNENTQIEFEALSKYAYRNGEFRLLNTDGTEIGGIRAVLIVLGHTGGLVGLSARILAHWPLYLLLSPWYKIFAQNRKRLNKFFYS